MAGGWWAARARAQVLHCLLAASTTVVLPSTAVPRTIHYGDRIGNDQISESNSKQFKKLYIPKFIAPLLLSPHFQTTSQTSYFKS